MTHELWFTLNTKMYDYLTSVTLSDLVESQLKKVGGDVSVLQDARRIGPNSRTKSTSAFA